MEYSDGVVEQLALHFRHGRVGTFESSVARDRRGPRKASGTFRAGDDVAPGNAVPPQRLEGASFIFRDRGMAVELEFASDFSGILRREGGAVEDFNYDYDVLPGSAASLQLTFPGSGETHECTMTFGARNSGIFQRRIIKGDQVRDADKGKFSGKGAADDDDDGKGGETEARCTAPKSLQGTTLKVKIGDAVVTILLNGSGTGGILKPRANGRISLQPFSYSYKRETCGEGSLTLTIAGGDGDEIQVFVLNFATADGGDCVRKRYEGGRLDDTGEGTFSLVHNEGEGDDPVNDDGHD